MQGLKLQKILIFNNNWMKLAWFQAFAAVWMRPSFSWDVTHCPLVVIYRRFGTTCLLGLL